MLYVQKTSHYSSYHKTSETDTKVLKLNHHHVLMNRIADYDTPV